MTDKKSYIETKPHIWQYFMLAAAVMVDLRNSVAGD